MELSSEMISLGTELSKIAGKSVAVIYDKIKAAKNDQDNKQTIAKLEELISELIDDKQSLIQIAQTYQSSLAAQSITEAEIEYVSSELLPIIETLVESSNDEGKEKMTATIELLKPILSKETIKIMQIMGFNYKEAIGQPLTELLASTIRSKIQDEYKYKLAALSAERDVAYMKLCCDPEAFERFKELKSKK